MSPYYQIKLELGPKPGILEPQAATLNRSALAWFREKGIVPPQAQTSFRSVGRLVMCKVEADDLNAAVQNALSLLDANLPEIGNPVLHRVAGVSAFEIGEE